MAEHITFNVVLAAASGTEAMTPHKDSEEISTKIQQNKYDLLCKALLFPK